ncbi:hypothetical protein APHCRT_1079 [Anaplasma phagocytophilum str. CRT53-1]|uniref:Uncharacterized protein n=1 Tax=Anaplasma phagocytophilum str. CRT53-1 TaxID=1359157 RepID=A0A0F3PUY3_ANAPH|nr:hypothetical protein APHCRT_1079 [Anaplasma phagocytophilum str. CRT53-1]
MSLDVAWPINAFSISSHAIPQPSSLTEIKLRPPLSTCTFMALAPASMEFSTSSFTTLAGQSITSPAAILLIVCALKTTIGTILPHNNNFHGCREVDEQHHALSAYV